MPMDFSLLAADPFGALSTAERKNLILATNRDAWTSYGLQLTLEESEMILQTEKRALDAENLVQLGSDITPRIIHLFLPSGYLGQHYALRVAELTAAFYRIKGSLQALYDEADDPECFLSDNALLDYMYRFFVSPNCAGDIDETVTLTERIIVGGMRRLLEARAAKRKAAAAAFQGDPVTRALYADLRQLETDEPGYDTDYERELYDYKYREAMHTDVFGNYAEDYDVETAAYTRGTYAEELEEALRRNPALLLPSADMEAEWEQRAEEWEELDAAALAEQKRRNGKEL